MRAAILAAGLAAAAISVSAAGAQTPSPPPQAAQGGANQGAAAQGGPANICGELIAFMKQPAPAQVAANQAPPAQVATAVNAPQGASPQQGGSPPAGGAQQAGAQPATGGQQASGQGAPPSAGVAGQIPATQTPSTPAEAKFSLEAAEGLARENNLLRCREETQKMRRAGVKLPDALIALAALDPKFYPQAAAQPAPQ